jgi:hypothetical protein
MAEVAKEAEDVHPYSNCLVAAGKTGRKNVFELRGRRRVRNGPGVDLHTGFSAGFRARPGDFSGGQHRSCWDEYSLSVRYLQLL